MAKAKIYNQEGAEIGEKELNPAIFGLEAKSELVHQAVVAQMANKRIAIAHAKDRSEIRGGGKKPWKQKGTGRARHGSIRSPLWRGGGVTFGPTKERNFEQKINKKAKKKALFMTLSDKASGGMIILIDKLEFPQIKTKELKLVLDKLPSKEEKTLISLGKNDGNVVISAANLPYVKIILADSLNVMDVLNCKYLIITLEGLDKIEETYLRKAQGSMPAEKQEKPEAKS